MGVATENIIRQVEAGVFDAELDNLEKAVQARVMQVRKSRTKADFGIGAKVKFNSFCGTKYLHGMTATVVDLKQKKLVVTLDNPVGRFARYRADGTVESSRVTVPPSIVDLV